MQTIEFNSYLGSVNDLFPCNTCLVIGVGSGSYINTLEALGFQDVILVDADEQQLEKMQKMHSVPSSYVVKNTLVYKDEANIPFYIATNPTVNCFKTIDTYKPLMPNISLLKTKELQSYTLSTFLQDFKDKEVNWLIIDTFTAIEILENSKDSFEKLEVIVCKTLSDTRETLDVFMLENGFKLMMYFEENNPKMGVAVYVKDYSVKNAKSETEKSALLKQLKKAQELVEKTKATTEEEKKNVKKQIEVLIEKEKTLSSKISELESEISKSKKKLFIDCGGYDGCSAIKFLLQNPEYDVITFEPNPELWDYYKDIPSRLIRKVVSDVDGITEIVLDPIDGDGSSIIKSKLIDATLKIENSECPIIKVKSVDLSKYIKKQSLEYSEIVLKLDVEGAEYLIFNRMLADDTLRYIKTLYIEFHYQKIGMSEEEHNNILLKIKEYIDPIEWDALEFAVYKKSSSTLKLRRELLKSIFKARG